MLFTAGKVHNDHSSFSTLLWQCYTLHCVHQIDKKSLLLTYLVEHMNSLSSLFYLVQSLILFGSKFDFIIVFFLLYLSLLDDFFFQRHF